MIEVENFDRPDECRGFPRGRIKVLDLGDLSVTKSEWGRATWGRAPHRQEEVLQ